jgi:hypothetical protein
MTPLPKPTIKKQLALEVRLNANERLESMPGTVTNKNIHIWGWSLAGFGLGVLSSSAYLLLGGNYISSIPRYADLLFYPGFAAGFRVYGWGLRESMSKVVGVLAVGLAYRLVAFLLTFACKLDAALREKGAANLQP